MEGEKIMKKLQKRPRFYILVAVLLIVFAVGVWVITAPKIERTGEVIRLVDGQFENLFVGGAYMEETRINEKEGQYQLIFKATSPFKPQVLRPKNEDELHKYLLESTVDAFDSLDDANKIIVSIPYKHDVYEVSVTRDQMEQFLNRSFSKLNFVSQEDKNAYFGLLAKQNKQKQFFEQFGYIY